MSYGKKLEKMMSMSDETWERHTNPWSGWTRVSIIPLFTLALVSRIWLGWGCLIPIILTLLWTWYNPRAFPKPIDTNNWMSKGVLGERIWLDKDNYQVASHHIKMSHVINIATALGLIPYIWGIIMLDYKLISLGMIILIGGKLWFLDRMVWLYHDNHPK